MMGVNNELVEVTDLTQDKICTAEDAIRDGAMPIVPLEYEHYFASGCYVRLMKCPAGSLVIGKPHRTEHISILLKGSCTITNDDGSVTFVEAPMIAVTPAGKKKMALVHEDMWFLNVHATETTDLDEIEKKVIIPEEEFRTMLTNSKQITKELLMSTQSKEVTS